MKTQLVLSVIGFGLWAGPVQGREPVRSITDLQGIEQKIQQVVEKVLPATVALESPAGASGSGVVVDKDGLILTAAHVIQGAEEMRVIFPDGKSAKGKVLGANFSKDLGMVRIIDKGDWPTVQRGDSDKLEIGDWVLALGHSAGYDPNRTPPVRFGQLVSRGPGNFFTTNCTLIGGDSGGPLFDLDGRLVGINSSIGTALRNNNHAAVVGFNEDWDKMLAGKQWGKLTMDPLDNPETPALGFTMRQIRRGGGVGVVAVAPRSPAAKAGLRAGDIVRSVDEKKVGSDIDLVMMLAKRKPGDLVTLEVDRDGEKIAVPATLARRGDFMETRE